jgi:hypothetical protein
MTGPSEAVETPKNKIPTKRISFHEFLGAYRSPLAVGDEIADLAADVQRDAKAPRANTRLIDYLLHSRNVPGDTIDEAVRRWKERMSQES